MSKHVRSTRNTFTPGTRVTILTESSAFCGLIGVISGPQSPTTTYAVHFTTAQLAKSPQPQRTAGCERPRTVIFWPHELEAL